MNGPDSPNEYYPYPQPRFTPELIIKLNSQKTNVLGSLSALLERNGINDEIDKKLVVEAMAFVENPSEDISVIMKQTTLIGQVLGGYMMQGEEAPAEIDALHGYLLAVQCVNRMKFMEDEIEKGNPFSHEVNEAKDRVFEWAEILSKGYNDPSCLNAIIELQEQT